MPVLTTPEEPSWDKNIYVLATTRTLVLIGTAYLVRSLYNLVSSTWSSRPAPIVAAAVSSLGLEDLNSDTLPMEPGSAGTDPDLEANLTVNVQRLQRSYDPQGHEQRFQASPRTSDQPVRSPESSVATNAIPEQDVGIRNDDAQVEEGCEISVGFVD